MKTKIIQNIKSIILALILVVGVSYVSAYSTWVAPTATAPGNNTNTPLNVGTTGQIKTGGLTLNTGGATNGLIVQSGNVGIGVTSPTQKLDVAGYVKSSTGMCIGSSCITAWPGGATPTLSCYQAISPSVICNSSVQGYATCSAGYVVTGGGYSLSSYGTGGQSPKTSMWYSPTQWTIITPGGVNASTCWWVYATCCKI